MSCLCLVQPSLCTCAARLSKTCTSACSRSCTKESRCHSQAPSSPWREKNRHLSEFHYLLIFGLFHDYSFFFCPSRVCNPEGWTSKSAPASDQGLVSILDILHLPVMLPLPCWCYRHWVDEAKQNRKYVTGDVAMLSRPTAGSYKQHPLSKRISSCCMCVCVSVLVQDILVHTQGSTPRWELEVMSFWLALPN